ncbi:hypothetical protein TNCV_3698061 [Trichonephila clavipes]|uniref:Uncharacterized protein n=1 Tax=Trichonephila clavipes TaxID=2585209 RepID=A0A8X6VEM9_TRICX|nr:hypothetical protein TNCV_3698061 [Trichonephila clavipes]
MGQAIHYTAVDCKEDEDENNDFAEINKTFLLEDESANFIKLNNKLSTVKEIIKEINQLKQSYCDLPEQVDLKAAQHLDQSENPAQ